MQHWQRKRRNLGPPLLVHGQFSQFCCTPTVTLEGSVHLLTQASLRSVLGTYSCSKPLFCIYPKSHTDSSIMSQPLLLHNGTTALKSPGSITTGCLWQCQERAGSKDNCAGITQCLQLLLNTQKPLQSGICDRVDGRGYCCFLPTRKSFLLLTSLHATTCDFCHNSTRIKCHPTCLY